MTDCLIIGFNDYDIEHHVAGVKSMGIRSGAFRDLDLALISYEGRHLRALDALTEFRSGKPGAAWYHNMDLLWPTITYLGSYLNQRGLTFDYVNMFHREKNIFSQKIKANPLLLAITTTLYVSPEPIIDIVSFARACNPSVKIAIGGPYIRNQAELMDEVALQGLFGLLGGDIYVISSEGEAALVKVINALKSGSDLNGIPNVVFRKNERFVRNSADTESNSLSENRVKYNIFSRAELGQFVSLRTAKSCPFACSFCGFPQRAGKYQYLPVKAVQEELDLIKSSGDVTSITFLDDTFNVPLPRFKDILRMMIRQKYGFRWNSFFRSDHSDEETISLMRDAGCEGVFLGVESGADSMLQNMNKSARTKDYRRVIPLLKAAGIFTHANLVIGFPGETISSFQETFRFIEEVQPDTFRAQVWYADPMTPIWKKKDQFDVEGSGFSWRHSTMDVDTASDLVEDMFVSIRNSEWLPQNGFELWSIFYLQRKGMSVGQIKAFLRAFNNIVREKIVTRLESASPEPVEELKLNCQFDDSRVLVKEMESAKFSVAECNRARDFWASRFKDAYQERTMPPAVQEPSNVCQTSVVFLQLDDYSNDFMSEASTTLNEFLCAAAIAFIARVTGEQEMNVLTREERPDAEPIPASVHSAWDLSFDDILGMLCQAKKESSRYVQHALYQITSLGKYQVPRSDLRFTLLWRYGEAESKIDFDSLATPEWCKRFPEITQQLPFEIITYRSSGGVNMAFKVRQRACAPETVKDLPAAYLCFLHTARKSPTTRIGDLEFNQPPRVEHGRSSLASSETFEF